MAVKGARKDEILAAFEERLEHDPEQEFATAIVQIELIALLRLKDRLPSLADVFSTPRLSGTVRAPARHRLSLAA